MFNIFTCQTAKKTCDEVLVYWKKLCNLISPLNGLSYARSNCVHANHHAPLP